MDSSLGEGIYETLRTYNHRPFLLDRHLRRLRASADRIGLSIPQSDAELTDSISSTMEHAGGDVEHYIRLLVTRGVGELSYDPTTCPQPTVVIIVKVHRENDPDAQTDGVALIVSSVLRNHPGAIDPQIKSNNLLNNLLAMQEAIRAGAQEALMRNYRGEISECAQSNFFLVKNGEAPHAATWLGAPRRRHSKLLVRRRTTHRDFRSRNGPWRQGSRRGRRDVHHQHDP